ncbi:sugar phosphate isomerase/epimerase [Catenibacillus scindens]|uniref:Sugar phosphate isomerase/epimerase n=1 Tax=Catenibacillus scindens TaxID=673271 RepID=A0A0E3XJR1_9FIRM|nr:sugar phosphate isomerase/epimerase [Catenibacillus scindens]AKC35074.1 Usg protein [Catenibacillus scindens]MBB5263133.1 sugar phosphate isomerase/epimerase [Catenibacillus scindens]
MESKICAQLYSLLKTNQKRSAEVLKQMSEIGFDGVELMGTDTCGMTTQEYKKYIADLNLDVVSSHNLKTVQDFEWAQEMDIHHTDIRPDLGDGSYDAVMRACEEMNREGEERAKYGIYSALHNHSQEFRKVTGREADEDRIYDLLIKNTDPKYVGFELDCGWCAFAGCDPVEYVKKYPGRFPLVHVKEALRSAYCDDELEHFPKDVLKLGKPMPPQNPKAAKEGFLADINYFTEEQAAIMYWGRHWNGRLGEGIINWKALSDALEAQGIEAYICEREYFSYEGGGDAYTCAKQDYEYLKHLLGR